MIFKQAGTCACGRAPVYYQKDRSIGINGMCAICAIERNPKPLPASDLPLTPRPSYVAWEREEALVAIYGDPGYRGTQ